MGLRVLFALGTRPEAIKLAPVIQAFRRRAGCRVEVCTTGQHRSLPDQVLDLFGIQPDYKLDLMQPDQDLTQLTCRLLSGLQGVLRDARPSLLFIQGDTATCFAGALAAFHAQVPVAHVEAGLRTGDPSQPFPEEMNRSLTDMLSRLCFTPTERARLNLLREGVSGNRIWVTGNTVIDALRMILARQQVPTEAARLERLLARDLGARDGERIVLVTMHRRESFGPMMECALRGIRRLVRSRQDVRVVFPVHPNPNVRSAVLKILGGVDRVRLVPPIDYYRFIWLMSRSVLVITDSGGVQEEAPALGKPMLVLRDATERPEGIDEGVARLVGTETDRVFEESNEILGNSEVHRSMARAVSPYGDGRASERIAEITLEQLGHVEESSLVEPISLA